MAEKIERRLAPRIPLFARVSVHLGNHEFTCASKDLSAVGMSLVSNVQSMPGRFVRLTFPLERDAGPVDVDGILVRIDNSRGEPLWGVEFHSLPSFVRKRIERFVRRRSNDPLHLPRQRSAARTAAIAAADREAPPKRAAAAGTRAQGGAKTAVGRGASAAGQSAGTDPRLVVARFEDGRGDDLELREGARGAAEEPSEEPEAPPAYDHPDRRRRHRKPPIEVLGKSPLMDFVILNLSDEGMAIETRRCLRVGTNYPFSLRYRRSVVAVDGQVKWCKLNRTIPLRNGESEALYRAGILFSHARIQTSDL